MEVEGYIDRSFELLKERFANNFADFAELGASVALSIGGELKADLYAGYLDLDRTVKWNRHTIVNVFSTTKTMNFIVMLLLYDQNALDFDDRVSKYWPEFIKNGKSEVTILNVLNHTAGLPGFTQKVSASDLYDFEKVVSIIENESLWFKPGSQLCYHALSQGYILGEVVRRITGKSIGQVLEEEFSSKLNADFFIGVPVSELSRVSALVDPPPRENKFSSKSLPGRIFSNPILNAKLANSDEFKLCEIPSANGHGNARSLVELQGIIANYGYLNGKRFLKESTVEKILELKVSGFDEVLERNVTFGMGYGLDIDKSEIPNVDRKCFWGGFGGSIVYVDFDLSLCFGYAMNKMGPSLIADERVGGMIRAIYEVVENG